MAHLKTRRVVEGDFRIINETIKLLRHYPELIDRIPVKSEITGFRDKLAPEYEDIDSIKVWTMSRTICRPLCESLKTSWLNLDHNKANMMTGKPPPPHPPLV
ncbi:MAG: hypothetical protein OXH90_04365 [Paracoccaceae bacterium]|nr:hypothetical protein [Paracoccaceae bacterium]